MKLLPSPFTARLKCIVFSLIITGAVRLTAQPVTVLESALTPTVILNGALNSLQRIEYSTDLSNPHGWQLLSLVRLDTTPKRFFDTNASGSKRFYRTLTVGVSDANLLWIPPGTFVMGSPANEEGHVNPEGPQTTVTLTKGFLMGRFEVKIAEWLTFMTNLPANTTSDTNLVNYLQRPVRNVVWYDATNYCGHRTDSEIANGRIPSGWKYRLPTEAEWEYACRAGTTTPFYLGNELRNDSLRSDAVFDGVYPYPSNTVPVGPVHPFEPGVVGSGLPNAFGLYNMAGNVSEWCMDGSITSFYPGGSVTNFVFPDEVYKACRGGNYFVAGSQCRSATRVNRLFVNTSPTVGFRVVLSPPD